MGTPGIDLTTPPDDDTICFTCDHFHQERRTDLLPGTCGHPEALTDPPTYPYDYCRGHSSHGTLASPKDAPPPTAKPGYHDHPSNPSTCQEWLDNQKSRGNTMAGRCPCYKDDT